MAFNISTGQGPVLTDGTYECIFESRTDSERKSFDDKNKMEPCNRWTFLEPDSGAKLVKNTSEAWGDRSTNLAFVKALNGGQKPPDMTGPEMEEWVDSKVGEHVLVEVVVNDGKWNNVAKITAAPKRKAVDNKAPVAAEGTEDNIPW